jgi:hypothetical protein
MAKHKAKSGFFCKISGHAWVQYITYNQDTQRYEYNGYKCDRITCTREID